MWLATQETPLNRSVALKILRPDKFDPTNIARFEGERRLVSMLNHPSLIKVFEAGTAEDGRPWFTMELAQGAPITEACDAARLSITDRVRLMSQVARAVHYAHEHGLVHRDLKPGNILLSFEADQMSVKVIDFGVAHSTFDPVDPDQRAGSLIGTPDYLAPELLRLHTVEPVARTDIFALGVILRRLLTGSDLGDRNEGLLSAIDVLDADLRDQVAADRNEPLSSLRHHLEGDLDAIVSHCLAADPRRRYATALDLAQDLDHFIAGEPVLARGNSLVYRGATAVRRNSTVITLSLLIVLVSLAGTIWAVRERQVAMIARDQAQINARQVQAANAFVVDLLTEIIEAPAASPQTPADILTEASRLAGLRLAANSSQEAHVRAAIGHLWMGLDRNDLAVQELLRAELLFRQIDDLSHLQEVRMTRATALRLAGRLKEARTDAMAALADYVASVPSDPDDVARAWIELAHIESADGQREEARKNLGYASETLSQAPGQSDPVNRELIRAMSDLGFTKLPLAP